MPNLCILWVNSRKQHAKYAAGHSLLPNLLTLTYMVLRAGLNLHLGALSVQPYAIESSFPENVRLQYFQAATPVRAVRGAAHGSASLGQAFESVRADARAQELLRACM